MFSLFFFIVPLVHSDSLWSINEIHHPSTKYGDMSQFRSALVILFGWSFKNNYRNHYEYLLIVVLTPSQLSRYESLSSSSSTLPPIRGGAVLIENSFNRWPNNTVPFTISSKYSNEKYVHIKGERLEMMLNLQPQIYSEFPSIS